MQKKCVYLSAATLLAALSLTIPIVRAQGSTATRLDFPGAGATFGRGINNNGAIVGLFVTSTGQHGFLLKNGSYVQIDVPVAWNALATNALGIADNGMIVGVYFRVDADGMVHEHGFCLMPTGSYIQLDVPRATDTIPNGISNANVVGAYVDQSGNLHGFVGMNGSAVTIDFPNAVATEAGGINNNGDVVGTYADGTGLVHGFTQSDSGEFSSFDAPGVAAQLVGTNGTAINDAGQVAGYDAKSKSHALDFTKPRADLHGFVMTGGTFVSVNVPGGINTCVFGLNNADAAVGQYNTNDGTTHAFYIQLTK